MNHVNRTTSPEVQTTGMANVAKGVYTRMYRGGTMTAAYKKILAYLLEETTNEKTALFMQ
jgi:hypothetical protein